MVAIALIQLKATGDRTKNLERALLKLDQAASDGAEVVCFAELAFEPFYPQTEANGDVRHLAETIPGPITEALCKRARSHGLVVVANLFERDGDRTFDTSPVIDADGSLLGRTRMVHITDYPRFHEQGYYFPGDTGAPVYETAVGKIGVAICYDRHYPEYMRALALKGASLVVIPQAGATGEWPDGLFEAEMRVASFQNGFFTALCNRVGPEAKVTFAGGSFICNPTGKIIARSREGEEAVLHAQLDFNEVNTSPARTLFLRDRRPDLYPGWLDG